MTSNVPARDGTHAGAAAASAPADRRWRGLAVLLAGVFMASLDVAIVNVAAPEISKDLRVSGTELVLVVSAYSLVYAMLLITGARLGNDHSHRRLFTIGLAGFTLASLACGLAPNGPVLIAARIVQGGFAAMMVPQVVSVIQIQFDGAEQARALGLYAMVLSFAVVAGQVIGGALVSANLLGSTWRPVFLVNVPIGIFLLVVAPRTLAPTRGARPRRLDLPGVGLLSAAVLLLVLPMIVGREQHWPPWTYGSLVAGVLLLAAGIAYLRRQGRRGGDPVLDLAVFASPGVARGLGSIVASMAAYGGFLFSLTLLLQAGLGFSALRSGLTFVPFAVGFAATSLGYTKLPPALQRWGAPAGLVCLAMGYAAVGVASRTGAWPAWPGGIILLVIGAGFGAGFSPVIAATLARVPRERAHDASGVLNTVVQLGYVVGVATLGSYYLSAAHAGSARSSGDAFATISIGLAVLALVAAVLAAGLRGAASKARHLDESAVVAAAGE